MQEQKFIYQNYAHEERVKMLTRQASKHMKENYNRTLSMEEVDIEKDKYTRDAIELVRLKKVLKAEQERLKSGITALETLMEERLERISSGKTEVENGTLYGIPNYADGMINFYDAFGELVIRRGLTPEERQTKMLIGNDPDEAPETTAEKGDEHITDVDYEEVTESKELTDEEYENAVDKMYGDNTAEAGDVAIEQTAPEEDKPKTPKKKAPKKPKKGEEGEDQPI